MLALLCLDHCNIALKSSELIKELYIDQISRAKRAVLLASALLCVGQTIAQQSPEEANRQVRNYLNSNGIGFVQNKGQIADTEGNLHPDILFKGAGGGMDIYLRKTGVSYVLNNMHEVAARIEEKLEELERSGQVSESNEQEKKEELMRNEIVKLHRVDFDFAGSNPDAEVIQSGQVQGYTNYYYGHCPQGVTQVRSYDEVTVKNVYNNIDVRYYSGKGGSIGDTTRAGLKYDIIVNPGGDPNDIKFKYTGTEGIEIINEELRIKNSLGVITEKLPKVYQNINGKIVDVPAKYILSLPPSGRVGDLPSGQGEWVVTFELGTWNTEYPLVVDPWATYYAGSASCGTDIAVDAAGNVLLTGMTASAVLPVSAGAFQPALGNAPGLNGSDAFLAKFTSAGAFVFGTFFGGSSYDYGSGVAVDTNNDILLTGNTKSVNMPTKNPGGGAYFQPALSGTMDAFVSKFTGAGALIWSTLYGGSDQDLAVDIVADASNNVIIVGSTYSINFPLQIPYQAANASTSGFCDAFLVKFNSGCVRQWATYYGGIDTDYGNDLVVANDGSNDVFFTGTTASGNFPVLSAFQVVFGAGGGDAYVARMASATGIPVWSTYYGGSGGDSGANIAIDNLGNCIMVGLTSSPNNISTAGVNQTVFAGMMDAIIVKFSSAGSRIWGTYHGGVNQESTGGVGVDKNNNIYWYGEVEDMPPNPSWITNPACVYQNKVTGNGDEDQFVSKFDPAGKLICTTAIGSTDEEDFDGGQNNSGAGFAVADPFIYITAATRGNNYPVTAGAFKTTSNRDEAFLNQLCLNICQPASFGTLFTASQTIVCPNTPIAFNSPVYQSCNKTDLTYKWTFTGGTPSASTISNPSVTYSAPGLYSIKLVVSTPCQKDSVVKTNYIIVNPCTIAATATGAAICPGNCATVSASGASGTSPYTYSWYNNGATTSSINICPTATTVYTVSVTDAAGNYAVTTASVMVYPAFPPVTTTSQNITCTVSGSATATVVGGNPSYTFNWSNGYAGSTSVFGTPPNQQSSNYGISAGGYTVTITDVNGCAVTKTYTITGTSPVSASFTTSATCIGSLINFTNTGTTPGAGITHTWVISPISPSNVSGTTANFSYTFLTVGTYSISHTVSNGTCSNTITKNISIINCNGPTVTATGSSVCPGNCAAVNASGTGGTSPYTYTWSSNATTQNINPCPASTTTYTVTIKDASGSTSTSTTVVTINPAVNVTTTVTNISCSGGNNGSVTAVVAGGSPLFSYNWSNGNTTSQISNLASQIYSVTVTDSKGCTAISTASIISPSPLIGQFAKGTSSCSGCGCKQWVMVNATGGTSPYSYSWPDGYVNRYKNQLCPGVYAVNIKDKNGCSVNVNLTVP